MQQGEIQKIVPGIPEEVECLIKGHPIMKVFIEQLLALISHQSETIENLKTEIKILQDRLNLDSHNSSKPPSSDMSSPKSSKSLRRSTGKPVGGQRGHKGSTLKMVDVADKVVEHKVKQCCFCGEDLSSVDIVHLERRQVFDIPEIKLEVTEHQSQRLKNVHGVGTPLKGYFQRGWIRQFSMEKG